LSSIDELHLHVFLGKLHLSLLDKSHRKQMTQ